TGRAGLTGIAVTLVDWEDMPRWKLIAQALEIEQVEPVETYSASPQLYEDLDIPEGTKSRLPKAQRTREGLESKHTEELGVPDKSERKQPSRSRQRSGKGGSRGGRGGGQGRQRQRTRSGAKKQSDDQQYTQQPRRRRNRTRRRNGQVVSRNDKGESTN